MVINALRLFVGVLGCPRVQLLDSTLKHCIDLFTKRFPPWSLPRVGSGSSVGRSPPEQGDEVRRVVRRRSMSTSLASKQGEGGALRPSHSSINWQLHVHVKPLLHCGSPRFLLGGRGGVGCCLCRAAAFAGSLVSFADDQLEGTDGRAPELADLFSAA